MMMFMRLYGPDIKAQVQIKIHIWVPSMMRLEHLAILAKTHGWTQDQLQDQLRTGENKYLEVGNRGLILVASQALIRPEIGIGRNNADWILLEASSTVACSPRLKPSMAHRK